MAEKIDEIQQAKEIDIQLYKSFLNGNKESFNAIVKKYRKTLISFIVGYVKNQDAAEDIAQDTFVYMLINKKEYDFKYTLKTYLYTIAKCRAINYLKKSKRSLNFEENYIYDLDYKNIDERLIQEETQKEIRKSIKKLKSNYQVAIYLRDIQGFQYKEICEILNKTMPQTKMLVHRARKSLEKTLKKEGHIC